MTEENKKEIAALLRERLASKGADGKPLSQRGWGDANRISNATVNQVLNGKWDLISDEMWRKFASALNYSSAQWELGRTRDYILLNKWLTMAQKQGTTLAISHEPGGGKTATLQRFADTHPNVFFLGCDAHWTKHYFLRSLYRALGKDPKELTGVELAEGIILQLRRTDRPLVILDELDKLNESILLFFISLYNKLDGVCGFILAGAPHLRLMVEKGASRDKRGYRELLSRVGHTFLPLNGVNRADVAIICEANGITEPEEVATIWNDPVVQGKKDIRRIKRLVERIQMSRQSKAA